jgi:hypothetical protein
MSPALIHPPFDPELATLLTKMQERGPFTLTTEMLPRMRTLEITEAELDERLRTRGLERRTFTVPGHHGDPINLAVIQRAGRTGAAACFYTIHGGGMSTPHRPGPVTCRVFPGPTSTAHPPRSFATRRWLTPASSGKPASTPNCTSGREASTVSPA